jgi:hypothetical protein
VRFEGFGAEEDEWVNVRKCIRQRSIPLESSQCRSISEGDLVLCFWVRECILQPTTVKEAHFSPPLFFLPILSSLLIVV